MDNSLIRVQCACSTPGESAQAEDFLAYYVEEVCNVCSKSPTKIQRLGDILCPGEWHNFPTNQDLFQNLRFTDLPHLLQLSSAATKEALRVHGLRVMLCFRTESTNSAASTSSRHRFRSNSERTELLLGNHPGTILFSHVLAVFEALIGSKPPHSSLCSPPFFPVSKVLLERSPTSSFSPIERSLGPRFAQLLASFRPFSLQL